MRFGALDPAAAAARASLDVHDPAVWRRAPARQRSASARRYMDGLWSTPRPRRARAARGAQRRGARRAPRAALRPLIAPGARALAAARATRPRAAAAQIAAHYDLGNDLFALLLDETMMYSCGDLRARRTRRCDEAPLAKLEPRSAASSSSRPGDHLLEIGTGWGGLAVHAARALRLPRHDHDDLARAARRSPSQRVRAAGLEDRVDGAAATTTATSRARYDKLVSIEMIEAVGWQRLRHVLRALQRPAGARRR